MAEFKIQTAPRESRGEKLDAGDPQPCDLGVITPYNAQALLLQRSLCEEEIEVKSVDGLQGREKELSVCSLGAPPKRARRDAKDKDSLSSARVSAT